MAQLVSLGGMNTQADKPMTQTLKWSYAEFKFTERQGADKFADMIGEKDWSVSTDYSPERAAWLVTVRCRIHPVFRDVTVWLATLTARATPSGGEKDGWGYENVTA